MPRDFIPGRREPEAPSTSLGYFFREALRRMWVSKRTSFIAVSMIAISLMIVGAFLLVAENLSRAAEEWQGKSRVIVYLQPEATPQQIGDVDRFLAARPELAKRRLVTRQEALARFRTWFTNMSDVVGQLDENPFPASFEIEVQPQFVQSPAFHRSIVSIKAMPQVDEVQYDWEWIARLRRLVSAINLIGLAAGGILAIAAAFTIANVIRLAMMLYREEIEIMRLVGATERIIRGPFLVEGFLQGTIGGGLSILLLFAVYETARRSLAPSSSILWSFLFAGFLPWQKILALIAAGTIAGFLGSWLSVRGRTEG